MIKLIAFIGNHKRLWISICMAALAFALHFPFLHADPDCTYNFSRDALSDEGLYSQQMRNFVHTGETFFYKSDVMAKTPFYQCLIYPIAKFSDGSRFAFRIFLVLLFVGVLGLFAYSFSLRVFATIFIALHALNIYGFSYFHYALPEGIAVTMILFSLYLFVKSIESKKSIFLLYAGFVLFLTYATKLIFINALGLIPFVFIAFLAVCIDYKRWLKHLAVLFFSLLSIGLVIYQLVFIQHREFLSLLFSNQKDNARFHLSYDFIKTSLTNHFQDEKIALFKPLLILSIVLFALAIAFRIFIHKKIDKLDEIHIAAFGFSFVWLLSEVLKFGMEYMPNRYFFSFHVALIVVISIVLSYFIQRYHAAKPIVFFLLLVLILFKSPLYIESWHHRKFVLNEINHRLNNQLNKGDYAIGVWSCGITWGCKLNSIPVWANFSDSAFVFGKRPRVLFTEGNQSESDSVFGKWRIDLHRIATKKYTHRIDKWSVEEWWLK